MIRKESQQDSECLDKPVDLFLGIEDVGRCPDRVQSCLTHRPETKTIIPSQAVAPLPRIATGGRQTESQDRRTGIDRSEDLDAPEPGEPISQPPSQL